MRSASDAGLPLRPIAQAAGLSVEWTRRLIAIRTVRPKKGKNAMRLLLATLVVGLVAAVSVGAASAYGGYPSYSTYYPSYTSHTTYYPTYRPSYYSPSSSYYGQLNAAGYPKNQWVNGYYRSNGTYVQGYWRNSPNDGLPTCRIIHC
jgi:hypothetical protein